MGNTMQNNPWFPGGGNSQPPWAQPSLQYGWGHGNAFFTPKTQAQIRREATLQLAILAAVIAAPAVAGKLAGSSPAPANATGAATSAQAAGASGGQASVATGAGSGGSAGPSLTGALDAFLKMSQMGNPLSAAQLGADALNNFMHESAPVQTVAASQEFASPFTANPKNAHPGMEVLNEMASQIERTPQLSRKLETILRQGRMLVSDDELVSLLEDALPRQNPTTALDQNNPSLGDSANETDGGLPMDWLYELFRDQVEKRLRKDWMDWVLERLGRMSFSQHIPQVVEDMYRHREILVPFYATDGGEEYIMEPIMMNILIVEVDRNGNRLQGGLSAGWHPEFYPYRAWAKNGPEEGIVRFVLSGGELARTWEEEQNRSASLVYESSDGRFCSLYVSILFHVGKVKPNEPEPLPPPGPTPPRDIFEWWERRRNR